MNKLVITLAVLTSTIFASLVAEAKQITVKDLEPYVKKHIVNHYKPTYKGDISVNIARVSGVPFDIEDGNLEIRVKSALRDKFVQRTVVNITVYSNGKYQRSLGVPCQLSLYRNAWVATEPISRDNSISTINVKLAKKDVSKIADTAAVEGSNLLNTSVKKTFKAGEVLDHRFIKKNPIVLRNSIVSIIVKSDTVSLSIPGEALEDGHIGDLIRVRNKEYRKDYRAKVIDLGTVLVNI